MATAQQTAANRQNAQSSTGPTTEAGKQKSSLNSTKHGFTGQKLIFSDAEQEAYEFHVLAYMDEYSPKNQLETNLVQQFADLNWSLHQIAVQQTNLMSLINAATEQLMREGNLEALTATLAQPYRTLNTLGIYEARKRRAASAIQAELAAMLEARREALAQAVSLYKQHKAQGKPFTPAEFGFVCSTAEIERRIARESAATRTAELHKTAQ